MSYDTVCLYLASFLALSLQPFVMWQLTITTVLKPECKNINKTIKNRKLCNYKYLCDTNKQHSQSEVRAIPTYYLSQSGMKLSKLVKLGETSNLLGFEYKLLLLYCVPFLSRE